MTARLVRETAETYFRTPALSKSGMDLLRRAPAHYRAWMDGLAREKLTDAFLAGSAFHCLGLEPQEFDRRYFVRTCDGTTKQGRKESADAKDKGLTLLPQKMGEQCRNMAASARRHPLLRAALAAPDAQAECSVYWSEIWEGVEIPCKARIDLTATVPGFGRVLIDLKSTEDASLDGFPHSLWKYGYHRQGAWYRHGAAKAGIASDVFVLLAVEKEAPYLVTAANIAESAQALALEEIRGALTLYAACETSGVWPGYTTDLVTEIDLPAWAYKGGNAA